MAGQLTLILGGARSGKSRFAEELASRMSDRVLFVATAEALDDEMLARIQKHQLSRSNQWKTLEISRNVGQAILDQDHKPEVILLDCITLLASNVMHHHQHAEASTFEDGQRALQAEIESILEAHKQSSADWILITNEVGLGLVPPYPLGRAYRDALGRSNQRLAEAADEVIFMVSGLPMVLKSANRPIS